MYGSNESFLSVDWYYATSEISRRMQKCERKFKGKLLWLALVQILYLVLNVRTSTIKWFSAKFVVKECDLVQNSKGKLTNPKVCCTTCNIFLIENNKFENRNWKSFNYGAVKVLTTIFHKILFGKLKLGKKCECCYLTYWYFFWTGLSCPQSWEMKHTHMP